MAAVPDGDRQPSPLVRVLVLTGLALVAWLVVLAVLAGLVYGFLSLVCAL